MIKKIRKTYADTAYPHANSGFKKLLRRTKAAMNRTGTNTDTKRAHVTLPRQGGGRPSGLVSLITWNGCLRLLEAEGTRNRELRTKNQEPLNRKKKHTKKPRENKMKIRTRMGTHNNPKKGKKRRKNQEPRM